MKQKKTYVTLLLIVALLALGIAYAAITGTSLTATTIATATEVDRNVDVTFTAIAEEESSDGLTVAPGATGTATGTVTVSGFTAKDQTATVKFTITNNEDDVTVTLDDIAGAVVEDDEWYDVKYTGLTEGEELEGGNSKDITMVITMKKTPTLDGEAEAATGTFSLTFKANPKANA